MWNTFQAISFNGDFRGDKRNAAILNDLGTHQRFINRIERERSSRQNENKKTAAVIKIQRAWRSYDTHRKALYKLRQSFDQDSSNLCQNDDEVFKLLGRRLSLFFNCGSDKQRLLKLCNTVTSCNDGRGYELPMERRASLYEMISKVMFCREHQSCSHGMDQDWKQFMRFIEKFAVTRADAIALTKSRIFDSICNVISTTTGNDQELRPNTERLWKLLFAPFSVQHLADDDRLHILKELLSTLCRHDYQRLTLQFGLHFIRGAVTKEKLFSYKDLGRALHLVNNEVTENKGWKYLNSSNSRFVTLLLIEIIVLMGGDPLFCHKQALTVLCSSFVNNTYSKDVPNIKHPLLSVKSKTSNDGDQFAEFVTNKLIAATQNENFSTFIHRFATGNDMNIALKSDVCLALKTVSWSIFLGMYLHQDQLTNPIPREANLFAERCISWIVPYLPTFQMLMESYSTQSLFGPSRNMLEQFLSGSSLHDVPVQTRQEFITVVIGYCAIIGYGFDLKDVSVNSLKLSSTVRDILASLIKTVFPCNLGRNTDVNSDIMGRELFRAALKAARACYESDCRFRFLPAGFWQNHRHAFILNKSIWSRRGPRQVHGRVQNETNFSFIDAVLGRSYDDDEDMDIEDEDGVGEGSKPRDQEIPPDDVCAVMLLRHAPFLVKFADRIEMFHDLIREDKLQYAGPGPSFFRRLDEYDNDVDIIVRRESIFEDAMAGFQKVESIQRSLRVHMINYHGLHEAGVDGGGVFREFLSEVLKTAFDPNRGLFLITDNQLLYPNPNAQQLYRDCYDHYFFIGRLLGKMIYEEQLTEFRFASCVIYQLFSRDTTPSVNFTQMKEFDPQMYKTLLYLCDCPDNEVDQLDLFFSTDEEKMGVRTTVELVPGGQDQKVTALNRYDYIECYMRYYLVERFAPLIQAMRAGFASVFDLDWLSLFSSYEQETLVSGIDVDFDMDEMRVNCNVTNIKGVQDKRYISDFWNVLRDFSIEEKKAFLKFVTGSPRAPLMGFRYLIPNIGIQLIHNDTRLPSSATCMNLLKLPKYATNKLLKEKLLYAIHSSAGFELS